ncbi:MAG: TetR family transcriptional regulator [Marinirhabdus sp.]|nr:TetR family transcriptional regulator [Marinirhabdus sp.]
MKSLPLHIKIDEGLYQKDPESSELGKKIVSQSIELMDELGFECFTFKKLGLKIGSNESSIYRYFDSKHTLLLYLLNWYWSWVEYRLALATTNVPASEKKLLDAIQLLTQKVSKDQRFSYIDEALLQRIIISESSKAYHTKNVDEENKKGFYRPYKRVVQRVSDMVLELYPDYRYPHMLISTVIEGAHQQYYFSRHLPSLTDVEKGNNDIVKFYCELVISSIQSETKINI